MRDDQRRDVANALIKVVGIAVVTGLVLAIGVFVMVKALGFSDSTPAAHATASPDAPLSTLPTRALTPSTSASASASASPASSPSASPTRHRAIRLTVSPPQVGPGQRINLTGSYPTADNVALEVQRKESGTWVSFAGVQAQVHVGTFGTYVVTSRTGRMSFRVFDPTTRAASNPVKVTVG